MVRRSTPQKIVDDRAFPIRILFYEKDIAVGNYARIMNWLGGNMRLGDYAEHGGPSSADRTIAYYFRTMEDAQRFRAAFADIELADGTALDSYHSPHVSAGKRWYRNGPLT
ncbi:hypothetical protein [Novosphingobium sp. ST904]|uniref:hypothetical protein n=1 Tax=Novosphingobium sp. ST904 TaxID=1684385 RepID=UPI00104B4134|nr:hypothetical protein [Novosphingobium sp. ST904]TCM40119.1 hypothetical protein EDF59_105359 [Novosphingobium sp. ST904]